MNGIYRSNSRAAVVLAAGLFLLISSMAFNFTETDVSGYSTRRDLTLITPYHAAAEDILTGESCLQMVFDYWGPSITQQDIRNVTKSRLDSDQALVGELVRAAHFSSQSWARGNQRGYGERSYGYGAFSYDWSDDSPRFDNRWGDIYESIYQGFPVLIYTYLDFPPELGTPKPPDPNNPQPPEPPQITPEDLAGLEKVWRLVVAYDTTLPQPFKLYDPLPEGTGAGGGSNMRLSREDLDRLWKVYELDGVTFSTHRIAMTAAPWSILELEKPRGEVQAGTSFEISANISYSSPPIFEGVSLQNPSAFLKLPDDFSMAEDSQTKSLEIEGTRSFQRVVWKVMAPDKTYSGQDYRFWINCTGRIAVSSDPAHIDDIGGSLSFVQEAQGFKNHPPSITGSGVDPEQIPDDGSIQPLITCLPADVDGNIMRVTVDLSSLGGSFSSSTRMYDDGGKAGTGDETADDGIYSYKIRREIPVGEWTFMITVEDTSNARAYDNVTLIVSPLSEFTESPKFIDKGADPPKVPNDSYTTSTLWAIIEDPENDIYEVTADLSPLGGDDRQELNDRGDEGDLFGNDENFSYAFTVGPMVPLDRYQIEISAEDATGHLTTAKVWIEVVLPPVPPMIMDILVDPATVVNDGEEIVQVIVTVEDDNDDVERVYADLTPLRGPGEADMDYEGQDTWSLEFTVPDTVSPGLKGKIDVTVVDSTGLTVTDSFALTVEQANAPPEILDHYLSKDEVRPGEEILIRVNVSDADNEPLMAEIDLTEFDLPNVEMKDDGEDPDAVADDLIFSGRFQVPESTAEGTYNISIRVRDASGGEETVKLQVIVSPDADSGASDASSDAIYYIILPSAGALILLLLIVAGYVVRKRNVTQPGRPAPGQYPPPPFGARPMR